MKNSEIVKMGYSDNPKVRVLEFRVLCEDLEDFNDCVKAIGEYNDFNSDTVADILEDIFEGHDLLPSEIRYSIGREYSPVIYLQVASSQLADRICQSLQSNYDLKFDELNRKGNEIRIWFD